MQRTRVACGGFLLVLGLVALVESARIKDDWPGARLVPAVLGLALVGLGAAHLVPARAAAPGAGQDVPAWPDPAGWRRVGFALAVLAGYVAVLPVAGFLVATALFALVLLRLLGGYGWPATLAGAAAIAVVGEVVFSHWLGMPLPRGPLGP
jgi:putative tricarboxylic transport membrane protein